jgi:hypothetical protein
MVQGNKIVDLRKFKNEADESVDRLREKDVLRADTAEQEKLRVYLQAEDRRVLERLKGRFGNLVDERRWRAAEEHATEFLKSKDFAQRFHREHPDSPVPDRQESLGYIDGAAARVDLEKPRLLETMVHERLHQIGHPVYGEVLGHAFAEGTTEYLARRESGHVRLVGESESYPREASAVGSLAAAVGDRAIEQAYFRGDFTGMSDQLDAKYGGGTFDRFRSLLESNHLGDAVTLLRDE